MKALVIVDMQNDIVADEGAWALTGSRVVIPNVRKILEKCRQKNVPVYHMTREHRADGSDVEMPRRNKFLGQAPFVVPGTKGAEIIPELKPLPGETIVIKKRFSGFFQTEFDALLRRKGVSELIVVGVQTPNCVRATVFDAICYDYNVTLVGDATWAADENTHNVNLEDMRRIGVRIVDTKQLLGEL